MWLRLHPPGNVTGTVTVKRHALQTTAANQGFRGASPVKTYRHIVGGKWAGECLQHIVGVNDGAHSDGVWWDLLWWDLEVHFWLAGESYSKQIWSAQALVAT